jgi:FAD/FMN-containing dehydrogenase
MAPHATGGVSVNFIFKKVGQERATYRENYDRFLDLKETYDPDNLFHLNQNVALTA